MARRQPKGTPVGGRFTQDASPAPDIVSPNSDDTSLPGVDRESLKSVLESAARLQQLVPNVILVGGSAAALWADHRTSSDHDHVLADLSERFGLVLESLEGTEGWVTNRVVPDKIILGELGGIETGVRQLVRERPLEACEIELDSGLRLQVPTFDETLRIKGYLIVRRNQTRDYLDVAALADRRGLNHAARVLAEIDDYYRDQRPLESRGVATQLARQLADPRPRDVRSTTQLAHYRELDPRWHHWEDVVAVCREVAVLMNVAP
jgi:hypothetical protein